ncbi:N-formylglutamate amidohydrolase [Roseibium sp. TrichSKD4]|uniref:N-formylglutamate amidohydrolase n=1 Tax=Roseibium sp. TrichSKD4 TaxID=744980 RepID=UPI0001E56CDE|nr:N-formylglutamate amidohydrolase [Roseibium sp. TrichSKD4]
MTRTLGSEHNAEAWAPIEMVTGRLDSGLLLLCDHASNAVPNGYGDLGLPKEQFDRHIAYDIGVRPLTLELAKRLEAPALLTTYSRLFIDPNRGEDDPTIVMRLSDGAVVPGNAKVDDAERRKRIEGYHRPYHQKIDQVLDDMIKVSPPPVIVSIHSFTPNWRGTPRPWHITVLWDSDDRAVQPLLTALKANETLVVDDNEPYDGALKNDCMYRHGTSRGLAHTLLEIRQDLIADVYGVNEWADRLAPILTDVAKRSECREIRHFPSRCD